MSPIPLGILASAGGAAPAFELISTQVLATNTFSLNFLSIPQTYKHLQLRIVARDTRTTEPRQCSITLNNSSTGYAYHSLQGNGATVTASAVTGASDFRYDIPSASSTAGSFSAAVVDLLDYASTNKNTTARILAGHHSASASASRIQLRSGLWVNTAAVTQITITTVGITFLAGSRFSLYGIKG